MKKFYKTWIVIIFSVLTIGLFVVLSTVFCYGLRLRNKNNNLIGWFTQNAVVDLNWGRDLKGTYLKYEIPKTVSERYLAVQNGLSGTIEDFCTGSFPGNGRITTVAGVWKNSVLKNSILPNKSGMSNTEYAEYAVGYFEDFSEYLSQQNINFLYVTLPGRGRISGDIFEDNKEENYKLYDIFSEKMYQSNVDYISISDHDEIISKSHLDYSKHWYPEDALKATKVIAEKINELYDLNYNTELLALDNYNYVKIDSDLEYDFTICTPKSDARVDLYIESFSHPDQIISKEGSINNDIIRTDINELQKEQQYFGSFVMDNSVFTRVNNKSDDSLVDKKILILGDSYSCPISSYICQGFTEVVAFHPISFNGSIKLFIEEYEPDLVIWMYQEGQIDPTNNWRPEL